MNVFSPRKSSRPQILPEGIRPRSASACSKSDTHGATKKMAKARDILMLTKYFSFIKLVCLPDVSVHLPKKTFLRYTIIRSSFKTLAS